MYYAGDEWASTPSAIEQGPIACERRFRRPAARCKLSLGSSDPSAFSTHARRALFCTAIQRLLAARLPATVPFASNSLSGFRSTSWAKPVAASSRPET